MKMTALKSRHERFIWQDGDLERVEEKKPEKPKEDKAGETAKGK
jgi:hypothetical protein